jgi:hypothetical protein
MRPPAPPPHHTKQQPRPGAQAMVMPGAPALPTPLCCLPTAHHQHRGARAADAQWCKGAAYAHCSAVNCCRVQSSSQSAGPKPQPAPCQHIITCYARTDSAAWPCPTSCRCTTRPPHTQPTTAPIAAGMRAGVQQTSSIAHPTNAVAPPTTTNFLMV